MEKNIILMRTNSFENPFDDINANMITPERILALWCTPFATNSLINFTEKDFCMQKLPIILEGSRGSGKTMILKYFSYYVLRERAARRKDKSVLKQIQEEKCIGFYFRCDDSFINTFKNIFENQSKDKWVKFFEYFLELQFSNQLITVLDDLYEELIEIRNLKSLFYEYINEDIFFSEKKIFSLDGLKLYVSEALNYIDNFKNTSIFTESKFCPKHLLELYSLSSKLINFLKKFFVEFNDVMFLILVDEFENLTPEIQKFFNTIIKFAKQDISLRVGRRSEGVITTATINEKEYLREKHDYFLIKINKDIPLKIQREYFIDIAKKRLLASSNEILDKKNTTSIIDLLGDEENLDKECVEICKGRTDHLHYILSEKDRLKNNRELREQVINIIKNPSNPIAETLNALWVIRSKDEPEKAADVAVVAMQDYFSKNHNAKSKKYYNDYNNKYRYSITALLASIYKRKKMYYGFNAIVHLSNGNTRTFLNLCRAIISDALFYEREKFFNEKVIPIEAQNRAISEFASSEFDSICSIIAYGNQIRNLVLNIGNVFAEYHKDKKVRYPETNQFVFNELALSKEDQIIIKIAESWSMIVKRAKPQRVSAGINRKGDIYYINRAFSPIFGISYRIRGGVNVSFSSEEIHEMMINLNTPKKLNQQVKKVNQGRKQISLFDEAGDE